ncbi:hypothetical protein CU001_1672 [Enterococcus faecium]|nr:hypothetical protein [Enterococcus faecium]
MFTSKVYQKRGNILMRELNILKKDTIASKQNRVQKQIITKEILTYGK